MAETSTTGALGFYDSAYQVAVFPTEETSPYAIIEHEITHCNLVAHTGIGLLEQVLVFLAFAAREHDDSEVLKKVQAMNSIIMARTELVHEAVAWFGTELYTDGHENMRAPNGYAKEVGFLRKLFHAMPGKAFTSPSEVFDTTMGIAEAVGVYALNIPLIGAIWSDPNQFFDTINSALTQSPNNPLDRFHELCSRFQKMSFERMRDWSEAVWQTDPASREAARKLPGSPAKRGILRRRSELPVIFRSDLLPTKTVQVIRTLAARLGLGTFSSIDDERLLQIWETFKLTHMFVKEVDRYSQVCVLEKPRQYRAFVFQDAQTSQTALASVPVVVVTLIRPSATEFPTVSANIDTIILTGWTPQDGPHTEDRPVWHASVTEARAFLAEYATRNFVVASSVGYDFGAGDFRGIKLLYDIPHVVVTIRDFRSLWWALAWKSEKGLAGTRTIEWSAAPSLIGNKYFGFIILKPQNKSFPLVLNPSFIRERDRTVSVAEKLPGPYGVKLVMETGELAPWLGPMMEAALISALTYEDVPLSTFEIRCAERQEDKNVGRAGYLQREKKW
jgi:hypothetical protein